MNTTLMEEITFLTSESVCLNFTNLDRFNSKQILVNRVQWPYLLASFSSLVGSDYLESLTSPLDNKDLLLTRNKP